MLLSGQWQLIVADTRPLHDEGPKPSGIVVFIGCSCKDKAVGCEGVGPSSHGQVSPRDGGALGGGGGKGSGCASSRGNRGGTRCGLTTQQIDYVHDTTAVNSCSMLMEDIAMESFD
jgi:hypothetical protein